MTFTDFYSLYPRKKSRGDAEKAWRQALKAGHQADEILAGLQRNLTDLQRRDPQFVPYPASWLRAQGWADEPDPISTQRNSGRRTIADAAIEFNARFNHSDDVVRFPQLSRH